MRRKPAIRCTSIHLRTLSRLAAHGSKRVSCALNIFRAALWRPTFTTWVIVVVIMVFLITRCRHRSSLAFFVPVNWLLYDNNTVEPKLQ